MLVLEAFGQGIGNQRANLYRRFYRANLSHHIASLSRANDEVEVLKTYHDKEGRLECDEWFKFHPNHRIAQERANVKFVCQEVTFVDSDHSREQTHCKASHFIQLCDVLAGATRYAIEAHNPSEARDKAIKPFLPLLERINDPKKCSNINSRYKHVGRANVSYFPSRRLEPDELENPFLRASSTFFKGRPLILQSRQGGQAELV